MTYKDCIKIASLYLDEDNLYNYVNDVDTYHSEETQQKIRYLCSCIDVILNEIASEYFPIKKIEKATAKAKSIEYASLSEYVLDIRFVKRNGRKVNYEMYSDRIVVDEDGEYEVCYEYTPKSYGGNVDENLGVYGRITPRVVAIGAVAEYCLAFDRFDEAITYDKMFKDALVGVAKSKGKLKVKERRWE
jgi:hypothetical protein